MHVVVVGTFDVGHAVPWRTGGGGDAYVAFESVMRVHARRVGGGIGGGAVRSTKRKLSRRMERMEERWGKAA